MLKVLLLLLKLDLGRIEKKPSSKSAPGCWWWLAPKVWGATAFGLYFDLGNIGNHPSGSTCLSAERSNGEQLLSTLTDNKWSWVAGNNWIGLRAAGASLGATSSREAPCSKLLLSLPEAPDGRFLPASEPG
jgi:hypothetical protein